jgi:hypothetical protein
MKPALLVRVSLEAFWRPGLSVIIAHIAVATTARTKQISAIIAPT